MNKTLRGDTFWRTYTVSYENETYTFQEGDVLKVAFCDKDNSIRLLKKHTFDKPSQNVTIEWSPEEMAQLESKRWILEVEVSTKEFRKTYQEFVDIFPDYIITEGE